MRAARGQKVTTSSIGFKHGLIFFSLVFASSLFALAESPVASLSPAPELTLPVECEVGVSCLIQKLVDHDPSTERRDYRCGNLTTDGHDGVDIRLRGLDDMLLGYAVVSAAAGKVLRVRDGEPDISSRQRGDLQGKDAGNGVVIDHGDGWETQYSHLRQSTVAVKPGQQIGAGQKLGLIGMSGNSEFPHLHFTVRHNGQVIDPFTGGLQGSKCGAAVSHAGLWAARTSREIGYVSTAIVSAGLSSIVPPRAVAERIQGQKLAGANAPIILWVDVIGAKAGDVQEFFVTGPDGRSVHEQQLVVAGGGLSWFAYSGKRAPAAGWPAGRYIGRYVLKRAGTIITETETKSQI